jgi:uncharacterized protein with PIN domain
MHASDDAERQTGQSSCPVCGKPVRLASEELLRTAFGSIKEETRQLLRLCERCRRRELQQKLIAASGDGKAKKRTANLL